MGRLTERWKGEVISKSLDPQSFINKLAEYEDLEEQGLLLRLPCPIGTTVYNTHWWDNIEEVVKVDGKNFYRKVQKYKVSKDKFRYTHIDDFGKSVFLTKAEAEEALKKMQEGGDE